MGFVSVTMGPDGKGVISWAGNSYQCAGMPGFDYTRDVTLFPSNAYRSKWSSEYSVAMEWAVGPIQWQRGAYIHAGQPVNSAGCIKVPDDGAERLYDYVKGNSRTRFVISYPW